MWSRTQNDVVFGQFEMQLHNRVKQTIRYDDGGQRSYVRTSSHEFLACTGSFHKENQGNPIENVLEIALTQHIDPSFTMDVAPLMDIGAGIDAPVWRLFVAMFFVRERHRHHLKYDQNVASNPE